MALPLVPKLRIASSVAFPRILASQAFPRRHTPAILLRVCTTKPFSLGKSADREETSDREEAKKVGSDAESVKPIEGGTTRSFQVSSSLSKATDTWAVIRTVIWPDPVPSTGFNKTQSPKLPLFLFAELGSRPRRDRRAAQPINGRSAMLQKYASEAHP
jgi:hypothetical protein